MNPRRGSLSLLLLMAGCVSKPAVAPTYGPMADQAALAVLRERAAALRAVRGEADLEMTDDKGQTVRLDGVYLLAPPDRARLRAWKLGTAVFDLTLRDGDAWAYLPRDAARPAAPGLRQSMGQWLALLGGRGDLFEGRAGEVGGDEHVLILRRATGDGAALTCTIDRATLTPREYRLTRGGTVDFRLLLSDYRDAGNGQAWPWTIRAESRTGVVEIHTREVEINDELPADAFTPPARAQALP